MMEKKKSKMKGGWEELKRKEIKFVGLNIIQTIEALLFGGSSAWTIYHPDDDRCWDIGCLGLNCQNCQ